MSSKVQSCIHHRRCVASTVCIYKFINWKCFKVVGNGLVDVVLNSKMEIFQMNLRERKKLHSLKYGEQRVNCEITEMSFWVINEESGVTRGAKTSLSIFLDPFKNILCILQDRPELAHLIMPSLHEVFSPFWTFRLIFFSTSKILSFN